MNPIQIGRRNHPSSPSNTPGATNTPTTSTPTISTPNNNNNNSAPSTASPQLQNTNQRMAQLRAQSEYQPLPLIPGAQNIAPQHNAQGTEYSNLQPLQSQFAAPINNNNNSVAPNSSSVPEYWNLQDLSVNNNNNNNNSSSSPASIGGHRNNYQKLADLRTNNNNNNNSVSSTAAVAPNQSNQSNNPLQRARSGNANNPPQVAPRPKDPNLEYVDLRTLSVNKKDTEYVGLANLSVNNNNNSIDPNKKVEK